MSDDDRIGRVARALCVADGQDPDDLIGVGGEVTGIGEDVDWRRETMAPAWTSYAGDARRFVAAAVALGLME